ncbi:TAXI family TRAP transporter solute-binding subunit [Paracoccus siganidrum]|uniref:TAXI family TRAP transporter solute-binding subunit n=1 Tax=Paracoccus siganidrum TaxID=1276757 RepID=A0A419A4T3_9RHOB|nr:TAXI family TRAP transporter solute-binding subunit [Paracoccus siganidrum]RJL09997.1 TAXI family TRAP transporter solute-binding subunit [Paracoccus siganidrum]RMC39611.1 C4-dicarboxylate ABC transporter substrate-binding protein [Paracoccus siganidrum]
MTSRKLIGLGLAAAMAGSLGAGAASAQQQFVTIGTGGVTGVYYAAGGAICRLMNQTREEHGFRCSAEATGGSVFNLNAMRQGEFDLGLVQSDWQYHALNGTSSFEDAGPWEDLRAVFSVHPEPFTVVARPDAGIAGIDDLRGKRFNIGNPGSGTQASADLLIETLGWSRSDFSLAAELRADEHGPALCDNQIDAFFYGVGHPSANIADPTTTCGAKIVPLEGEAIDQLVEENPYYAQVNIPGGLYTGNPDDIPTYGVLATLVASTDVSEEAVYNLVRSVFENFDSFRSLHPAFANLTPEEMVQNGNSAPLHPGAERYYREQGWL